MNGLIYFLPKGIKREPYLDPKQAKFATLNLGLEHGFIAGSNMVMRRAVRMAVEAKTK